MTTPHASNTVCPKCGAAIPPDAPQGICPACVLGNAVTLVDSNLAATSAGDVPALDRVQAAFPQLEILELIGRGGMGFVFKARQPQLDRCVALKLLPDKLARDPQFAQRFNREGRVLARLNHPNIVTVFDFGRTEHFYFLTMEYVDGVNLRQAMQAGRFSPTEALGIVPKICEALQYAHEQGVLHRDIKPENILLDAKGRVKIADFGIAKLVEDGPESAALTGTGAALGTLHYMAPEQLEKPTEVDHRADIYSLGVVFYEMLTGELPIGRFAPPSAKTPVDESVDQVVFRTLEKDRDRRYQSAGQVKTEVEHLTQAGATPRTSPPPAGRTAGGESLAAPGLPGRTSRSSVWGAVLTGIALVLLGGPLAIVLLAGGGLGPLELLLFGAPGALCALAGSIVGWVALSQIREGRGVAGGLPVALFAAVTWPLLVLVGAGLLLPWLTVAPGGGSGWIGAFGRGLVLLLPAGTLTFALWAAVATARWASGQPPAERRGILKWIFAGLVAVGVGVLLLARPSDGAARQAHPVVAESGAAPRPPGLEPVRVRFKVPKGQVAVFELCRHAEANRHEPVPSMSGYVVAAADESAPGEVSLEPLARDPDADASEQRWTMRLLSEDGGTIGLGSAEFGPLQPVPGAEWPLRLPSRSPAQSNFELALALAAPAGPAHAADQAPSSLSLSVRLFPLPVMHATLAAPIVGGGTNWEEGLGIAAMLELRESPREPESLARIRFTVTGVALHEEDGHRWLALDFLTAADTNRVTVVRAEPAGFETETRRRVLVEGRAGLQLVRHERTEIRLPAGLDESEAATLRDELAKALVARPVEVPTGREIPLFKLPVGDAGLLEVVVGGSPVTGPTPPGRLPEVAR